MKKGRYKIFLFIIFLQFIGISQIYSFKNIIAVDRKSNENKSDNIMILVKRITNGENIRKVCYEGIGILLEDLLDNGCDFHIKAIGYKNYCITTDNIQITYKNYYREYLVTQIEINENSKYMELFPYEKFDEYLSDTNFGEIVGAKINQLKYYAFDDTYMWRESEAHWIRPVCYLNFNDDGFLINVTFLFEYSVG